MGFDTSFHPVDVSFVHERILLYLRGEGSIDDLVARAVRLAKVRFRANAWGLGVLHLQQASRAATRPARKKKKQTEEAPPPAPPSIEVPAAFEADLSVWGRPFFITATTTDEVCTAVDRYLAAAPEQVDDLAREMLARLDPRLLDHVQPDSSGMLPDDERLAHGIRWKIDLFRLAYAAYLVEQPVKGPGGEEFEPAELFAGDFPLAVLEFAAHFTPGWMARGYVWPTYLLGEANLLPEGLCTSCAPLFAPLIETIPEIADNLDVTITANYQVGGFVAAENVPTLHDLLMRETPALLRQHREDYGWNEFGGPDLVKICEAVEYARRHKLAFAEATEIYSGIEGVLN